MANIGLSVGARALKVSDIDNDSLNEIVVGLQSSDGAQLRYYEHDSGDWTETVIADTISIHCISIGDLDGDEYDEILIGGVSRGFAGAELCYFELDSGEWVSHDISNPDILVMATAIGDLDNDGTNEVAMGLMASEGYELRYYEYDGGTWTEFNVDDDLGEADGIEIADIDHDEENELIFLGSSLTDEALCYYDYNEGSWNKTVIPCHTGWEMDTGDVDNDGDIEIAWGNYFEPDNEVRVYDYVDDSWMEVNVSDMKGCTDGTGVYHVAIGDVDNDGLNELAIGAEHIMLQVRYYEYTEGSWIEHNVSTTPYPAEVVEIGDVDNDGSNEILVGLRGYYGVDSHDEVRYYEESQSTTTSSETTNTSTTPGSWQPDPMLLVIGIGTPLGVVFVIALWRFRKKH